MALAEEVRCLPLPPEFGPSSSLDQDCTLTISQPLFPEPSGLMQVGKMVPLVGGPAYADNLVPLLEKLAREEETVVRDAAVQSLSKVAASFTTDQALEHLVPCVRVRSLGFRKSSCHRTRNHGQ